MWQCSARIHTASSWLSLLSVLQAVSMKWPFETTWSEKTVSSHFFFSLLFLILSCQFEILASSISVLNILAYSFYPCYYDLYFLNQRGENI